MALFAFLRNPLQILGQDQLTVKPVTTVKPQGLLVPSLHGTDFFKQSLCLSLVF